MAPDWGGLIASSANGAARAAGLSETKTSCKRKGKECDEKDERALVESTVRGGLK